MSDISSEQAQASQRLEHIFQENEQIFRVVWEFASDAMALSTPDGTVIAANPAYFHLYGFAQEEVIGKHFSIIFPHEQRATARELYDLMFRSPAISPVVVGPVRRADGTERFVESRYTFLLQGDQRIAMLSVVRDVTEQKRKEEYLWVSEEKLRMALEAGHLGSWDWDIESNRLNWTVQPDLPVGLAAAGQVISYEAFLDLVHPADRVLVDQALKHTLAEGTDFAVEFRTGPDGDTPCRMRLQGQVLHDEAGKPTRVIGISMDISPGEP
jgi:PAS domain S-box-containing protein